MGSIPIPFSNSSYDGLMFLLWLVLTLGAALGFQLLKRSNNQHYVNPTLEWIVSLVVLSIFSCFTIVHLVLWFTLPLQHTAGQHDHNWNGFAVGAAIALSCAWGAILTGDRRHDPSNVKASKSN